LADLEQIERTLPNIQKRSRIATNKEDVKLADALARIQKVLQEGKIAHVLRNDLSAEEWRLIKPYNFLTMKPFVYAINISQEDI
jgi:hypothetical protein